MHEAHLFSDAFRIIVNFSVIQKHLEFDRNFKNISSRVTTQKKKNISTSKESFLDLPVIIENKMS